jgi:hypothetical protein
MLDQQTLDTLIAHLREDLDQIDRAILSFERMAAAGRARARRRVRRELSAHVDKTWTKHRCVTD